MDTVPVADLVSLHLHLTLSPVLQSSKTHVTFSEFVTYSFQVGLVGTASRLTQED